SNMGTATVVTMLRHRLVLITVLAGVIAVGAASPAFASHTAKFGVQDDAWILYGPGTLDQRLATLDKLGVKTVRITLRWDRIAAQKPADQRDPDDPNYVWGTTGDTLLALHQDGIATLVTIWGSPRWANGGRAPNYLPRAGLGNFAYAASKRFPWIHMWTIWNEPNLRTFSNPVSPSLYVKRLLNPAYANLHAASRANKVAGGVTSPRRTSSGISPLTFMAGMAKAHAHLDAYAQNPYPGSPRETPDYDPCTHCETFTMARLSEIRRDVTHYFGFKPLWLTEYGYQTNPPDRLSGVSPLKQAAYLDQAALKVWQASGVTVLIQFLIKDEPGVGGWQSGLISAKGTQKPAFRAFALPLVQLSRSGNRVTVWGQVRPGHGVRTYFLQRWNGKRWVTIGSRAKTYPSGTLIRKISGYHGEKLRITTPLFEGTSQPVVLS
ncbi:MAG TPA: hypothetical protein VHD91_03870, partial [Gaiellaceae bacterium]|nr:hypothetical protein [Gaiellaceae bacterium]